MKYSIEKYTFKEILKVFGAEKILKKRIQLSSGSTLILKTYEDCIPYFDYIVRENLADCVVIEREV